MKESGNNEQHQALHEDEKTRDENTILTMCIGISDIRPQDYPACQPCDLPFSIPHNLS